MKRSVLKKLLIYPIILLVPVNLLLIALSVLQFSVSTKEAVNAIENGLNIVTAQIESDVAAVNQYINLYVSEDVGFVRLSECEYADMDNKTFFSDFNSNLKKLSEMGDLYPEVSAAYMKFPCLGTYCARGINGYRTIRVLQSCGADAVPEYVRAHYVFSEGNFVLYVWNVNGTLVGYRYELSDYIKNLCQKFPLINSIQIVPNDADVQETPSENSVILRKTVASLDMEIQVYILKSALVYQVPTIAYVLLILALVSVAVVPVLSLYYYRQIFIPMQELGKTMWEIRHGKAKYRAHVQGNAETNEFVEFAEQFNVMIDELQQAKVDMYELELREKEMQLDYYSQQIRPHFILNALNRVYTHEQKDWNYVKEEILCLSKYFRYVVNVKKTFVSLSEEMKFIRNYLEIQKMIVGDYFYFMVSWQRELDHVKIPPLIFVSFVENCIKHALSIEECCCIAVTAEIDGKTLIIRIIDSGKGFSEDVLNAIEQYEEGGQETDVLGIGITNTLQRIHMLYGEWAKVCFKNDNGAVVELILPYKSDGGD